MQLLKIRNTLCELSQLFLLRMCPSNSEAFHLPLSAPRRHWKAVGAIRGGSHWVNSQIWQTWFCIILYMVLCLSGQKKPVLFGPLGLNWWNLQIDQIASIKLYHYSWFVFDLMVMNHFFSEADWPEDGPTVAQLQMDLMDLMDTSVMS